MIDKTNETSYESDLMTACNAGNIVLVKKLLGEKPNLKARVYTGDTPLHFAAMGGKVEIVKMLLAAGAELTECDYCGRNILHTAAIYGQFDLIRFLLDNHYFDVNCPESAGETIVVEEHDVLLQFTKECQTALHESARKGNIAVAKLLLEYGADINSSDVNGKSPLHHAVEKSKMKMVGWLLEHGADINHADKEGWTPAAQALLALDGYEYYDSVENKQREEIFNFLRQKGAVMGEDVMLAAASQGGVARDQLKELLESHQYTSAALNKALIMANAHSPSYPEWNVKILLQHGALPVKHVKGVKGNALQYAVINGRVSSARLLVNAGADVEIKDSEGNSLVMLAAIHHQLRMLKWLVSEFKLPCDEVNKKGSSPLLGAVETISWGSYSAPKVVDFLISCGADVNRRNGKEQTALHLACANNATTVVKILLAHGADRNLTDKDGKTPADLTKEKSIVKLLGE